MEEEGLNEGIVFRTSSGNLSDGTQSLNVCSGPARTRPRGPGRSLAVSLKTSHELHEQSFHQRFDPDDAGAVLGFDLSQVSSSAK